MFVLGGPSNELANLVPPGPLAPTPIPLYMPPVPSRCFVLPQVFHFTISFSSLPFPFASGPTPPPFRTIALRENRELDVPDERHAAPSHRRCPQRRDVGYSSGDLGQVWVCGWEEMEADLRGEYFARERGLE